MVIRSFDWRGERVKDNAKRAAMDGLEITAALAVQHAKSSHGWNNRTGTAEGSIQMRPAVESADRIFVTWGSFDVHYFIYLELGTAFTPGDMTLQRAADATYPQLIPNIQKLLN